MHGNMSHTHTQRSVYRHPYTHTHADPTHPDLQRHSHVSAVGHEGGGGAVGSPGAHPTRAAGPVEIVRYGGREVKQDHVVHLGRGGGGGEGRRTSVSGILLH